MGKFQLAERNFFAILDLFRCASSERLLVLFWALRRPAMPQGRCTLCQRALGNEHGGVLLRGHRFSALPQAAQAEMRGRFPRTSFNNESRLCCAHFKPHQRKQLKGKKAERSRVHDKHGNVLCRKFSECNFPGFVDGLEHSAVPPVRQPPVRVAPPVKRQKGEPPPLTDSNKPSYVSDLEQCVKEQQELLEQEKLRNAKLSASLLPGVHINVSNDAQRAQWFNLRDAATVRKLYDELLPYLTKPGPNSKMTLECWLDALLFLLHYNLSCPRLASGVVPYEGAPIGMPKSTFRARMKSMLTDLQPWAESQLQLPSVSDWLADSKKTEGDHLPEVSRSMCRRFFRIEFVFAVVFYTGIVSSTTSSLFYSFFLFSLFCFIYFYVSFRLFRESKNSSWRPSMERSCQFSIQLISWHIARPTTSSTTRLRSPTSLW